MFLCNTEPRRSDTLVVVVCEETGQVSVAQTGRLDGIDDGADIEARLSAHFNVDGRTDRPARWKWMLTSTPGARVVSVTSYELTAAPLPLAVRTEGKRPAGRKVASLQPDPPVVDVRVREALENRVTEIPTMPVDLSDIEGSTTVETTLVPLPNCKIER